MEGKKRSTIVNVLIIVVCVLLVGGIGAGIYFMNKQARALNDDLEDTTKSISTNRNNNDKVEKPDENNKEDNNTIEELTGYLCISKDIKKGDMLYLNSLTSCSNKFTITKEDLERNGIELSNSYNGNAYYINMDRKTGDSITLADIYWKLENVTTYKGYNQEGNEFKYTISNGKLLLNNVVIFDEETVKSISVRKVCCAGEYHILILTSNGNVYYNSEDLSNLNNNFSKSDITFNKQSIKDIIEFHENINLNEDYMATTVTAIDNSGNSFVID